MRRFGVVVALLCVVVAIRDVSAETLRLLYDERPPYYTVDADGVVGGVVSGPVDRALKAAGIEVEWVRMPSSRQLFTIRNDTEYACSPGWFKNPERLTFAKFSEPVYCDKPQIIAIRKDDAGRFGHQSLAEVLADPGLTLGVKNDYSYGPAIDGMIGRNATAMVHTAQTVGGMRIMLSRHRFDYFIAAPEEFETLAAAARSDGGEIMALSFPDIPAANERYLMCAMQVDDALIEWFNAALEALGTAPE